MIDLTDSITRKHPLISYSANELVTLACQQVLNEGVSTQSRYGKTIEICDQELFLLNPRKRHVYLDGRTNNLYATIAETIWVMAGQKNLHPLMDFFLPRCKEFSDNGGVTWRGAYGRRLYHYNQIDNVVQTFLKDGKNTRRAVIAIYQPQFDTDSALAEQGIRKTKDLPCSNLITYWIRDNKLFCKLNMRSNDVIWGFSHINLFEFTFLQEIILELLKIASDEFKDVELGYYHHSPVSLHIYNDIGLKQANNIVENHTTKATNNYGCSCMSLGNLIASKNSSPFNIQLFFELIYDYICRLITQEDFYCDDVDKLFSQYVLPKQNNQLYHYLKLVESYILDKNGTILSKDQLNYLDDISDDLREAIKHSKFTPNNWREYL